jgi:acetylornithine deacetylase
MEVAASRVLEEVENSTGELINFTRRLIMQRSVTGYEGGAQEVVAEKLRELGARVDSWSPNPQDMKGYEPFFEEERNFGSRPNVVGLFGPRDGGQLAFNGHIDVVPEGDAAAWVHPPYGAEVDGGRIYGRGACDMKAGLAASIFAIQAVLSAGTGLRRGLMLASVIGEESGGVGTLAAILRGHVPRAAIIAEPTGLSLVVAQAGCLMFRLRVRGRAAAGATKYMGVSAVEKFQPVLSSLLALERRRARMRRHPLYRHIPNPVALSVGTVRAGNWDSTVPDELVAEGRYGVWPGESLASARRQFLRAVSDASSRDEWLRRKRPEVTWFGPQWESAEISPRHWLPALVSRAYGEALGGSIRLAGTTGGTDMRLYQRVAKVPAVVFGPGEDEVSHLNDEWVSTSQLVEACKVLAVAAMRWNE